MVKKVDLIKEKIEEDYNNLIDSYNKILEQEKKIMGEKASLEVNLHRIAGAKAVIELLNSEEPIVEKIEEAQVETE